MLDIRSRVFRTVARTLIKPAFSPWVPPEPKRRWIHALTRTNLTPRGMRREDVDMGDVPGERITVGEPGVGVILYLHGGGYVFGSPATHRSITGALARAAAATVYAPDYRLAPEHHCPAAVDDAVAAYRWLLDQGVAAERIVIAGDSAGGGLTLATALALREAGTPLPAGLIAISPWTDLTLSGESIARIGGHDPMLSAAGLGDCATHYLGEHDPEDPVASPLFADLHGLPPLCIQVGSDELLLADSERLAERARAAGVAVEDRIFDGLWHVFQLHAGALPAANEAVVELATFARRRWGEVTT